MTDFCDPICDFIFQVYKSWSIGTFGQNSKIFCEKRSPVDEPYFICHCIFVNSATGSLRGFSHHKLKISPAVFSSCKWVHLTSVKTVQTYLRLSCFRVFPDFEWHIFRLQTILTKFEYLMRLIRDCFSMETFWLAWKFLQFLSKQAKWTIYS